MSGVFRSLSSGVRTKMTQLRSRTALARVHAVENFAEIEMEEMHRRVPKDTGDLDDSGYIGPVVLLPNGVIRITLGFNIFYAVYVHEDLEAFHPNGEAKFVESVLNESKKYFNERVVADMKKEMGL